MTGCSALGCRNSSEKGYQLYRFPKNLRRRRLWVARLGREQWEPKETSCVCRKHFDESMFTKKSPTGRWRLKKNAIPLMVPTKTSKEPPTWVSLQKYLETKEISEEEATEKTNLPLTDTKFSGRMIVLPPFNLSVASRDPKSREAQKFANGEASNSVNLCNDIVETTETGGFVEKADHSYAKGSKVEKQQSNASDGFALSSNSNVSSRTKFRHILPKPSFVDPSKLIETVLTEKTVEITSEPRQLVKKPIRFKEKPSANPRRKTKIVGEKEALERQVSAMKEKLKKQEKAIFALQSFLNPDQIDYLSSSDGRGHPWSDETIKKAMYLRKVCGSSGYKALLSQKFPLPSIRTLQRKKNLEVESDWMENSSRGEEGNRVEVQIVNSL